MTDSHDPVPVIPHYVDGTAIFTSDGSTAAAYKHGVTVGMVGVKFSIPVPVVCRSFGGWKQSLLGQANTSGPEGVGVLHPSQSGHRALDTGEEQQRQSQLPKLGFNR